MGLWSAYLYRLSIDMPNRMTNFGYHMRILTSVRLEFLDRSIYHTQLFITVRRFLNCFVSSPRVAVSGTVSELIRTPFPTGL
jgi:hypothetical protein